MRKHTYVGCGQWRCPLGGAGTGFVCRRFWLPDGHQQRNDFSGSECCRRVVPRKDRHRRLGSWAVKMAARITWVFCALLSKCRNRHHSLYFGPRRIAPAVERMAAVRLDRVLAPCNDRPFRACAPVRSNSRWLFPSIRRRGGTHQKLVRWYRGNTGGNYC